MHHEGTLLTTAPFVSLSLVGYYDGHNVSHVVAEQPPERLTPAPADDWWGRLASLQPYPSPQSAPVRGSGRDPLLAGECQCSSEGHRSGSLVQRFMSLTAWGNTCRSKCGNASRICVSSLRLLVAVHLCQLKQIGTIETIETRSKYLEQN